MQAFKTTVDKLTEEVSKAIAGKQHEIRLVFAGFLSGGHILLEDIPGVGKTTLAKSMAAALGLEYKRIQFTSDLLPADILGVNYFDAAESGFVFQPGAIFTQFLLADEINRATPKTQSALLEAMEEHQVSIEGQTRSLPEPFFVIATQNPFEEAGTFALPSSQLDRFTLSLSLGYPDKDAEREVLKGTTTPAEKINAVVRAEELVEMKKALATVRISDAMLDYMQKLIAFSRESGVFERGISTRAALALSQLCRAWALLCGRDYVIPEDIQEVLPSVVGHRLLLKTGERVGKDALARRIIEAVSVDE